MAERNYPGVYTEEKSSGPGPVQGVSTSNLGLVGFTLKGPIDDPILSTSFTEWEANHGGFTEKSLTPTMAYAFFANGGSRIYTVRVTADDAVSADSYLSEDISAETGPTGTGAISYSFTLNKMPVVPSSVSIVAATVTFTDDGSGVLTGTGAGGGSGSIDYTTGEVFIQFNTPGDFAAGTAEVDYSYKTYEFWMQWPGEAGDNYRVVISGSPDYEDITNGVSSASWSRFDMSVQELVNGTWVEAESFKELSMDDPNDTKYIVTVVNDDNAGSSILTVVATGNNMSPSELAGEAKTDEAVVISPAYDGLEKEITYTTPDAPYPTTITLKASMIETAFSLGTGDGSATPTTVSPEGPIEAGDGTLVGTKVVLTCTLDLAGASTYSDDGAGQLTDDGTPAGDSIGTVNYATGAIALDASALAVADTFTTGTAITVALEYSNSVDVVDDGNGNMAIATASTGPSKFSLNDNGTNSVDYDTGVITLTWKLSGNPSAGPDAGSTAVVDYYTTPSASVTEQMSGGADGSATSRTDVTAPALVAGDEGLYALNKSDELMQVVIADFQTDEIISGELIDYCDLRKDRFAIISVPEGLNPQETVNWKKATLNKSTSRAALYAPHIKIIDPVTDKAVNVPAGGHVSGIYARTDQNKNVSKAPAGVNDGKLAFLIGFEQEWTDKNVGVVYPNSINALVSWPQTGRAVWGARTLDIAGGEWPYIQMRRLFMFLEKSIFNSTHIHVFENNGPDLWAKIRFQVEGFLLGLYNEKYFSGNSPEEAFRVVCDRSNNPQVSVDQGLVFCDVYVAPTKPAEFIVFRFQQLALSS